MEQVANPGLAADFRVCSLFYCSENGFFYGVPFDCRRQSVQRDRQVTGRGWRRLMFKYTEDEPPISAIGFDSEYHVLAARGSPGWMPQLVPASYDHNQAQLHGVIADRTGLAGDLSVILGMAALSGAPLRDPRQILSVIGSCFRPPQWRRHNLPIGSKCLHFFIRRNVTLTPFSAADVGATCLQGVHGAGVVVQIRVDPTPPVFTANMLANLQAGAFGSIIAP
jgi:hypothetical protein